MAEITAITARHEKVILALLRTPTIKEASQQSGVGERTIWRWLQDDTFQEAYMEARKEAFSRAVGLLQQALSEAILVLREMMNNPETRDSSRVSSARAILDIGLKARELDDLEERISKLEKITKEVGE